MQYGFAYKMPLSDEPACYAAGIGRSSLADFRELLRQRSQGIARQKTAEDLWRDELFGKKRHLTGLFRDAYPASMLSEAHVRAAELVSQPIGKLTALDESRWLWVLSRDEIPAARAMLENKKLLVAQAERQ